MRESRFSDQQIIDILQEHDQGAPTQELCRKHGISAATIYKWRSKYAGLDVAGKRRLDHLEAELAKAKRALDRLTAESAALKEAQGGKALKTGERRKRVDWAVREKGYSQRQACALFGIEPSVYRYKSRRKDDGPLRERIREIALANPQYGHRRIHEALLREGHKVNSKKVQRIYREEHLTLRKRRR